MSIRLKIIVVVLPLMVAAIVLAGASSYFLAASSVNRVAQEFLTFKAEELSNYANGQWNLLVDNGLVGRSDMEEAAKAAIASFGRSILRSNSETIFAVRGDGSAELSVGPAILSPQEGKAFLEKLKAEPSRFHTLIIGGHPRVAVSMPFAPFNWSLLVTEEKSAFYGDVEKIARLTLYILLGAVVLALVFLLILAKVLMNPAERLVATMRRIIESNRMDERVPVVFRDEIGQVSHTFNLMLDALDAAYGQIKHYAFDAVVAQKKETKIRNIFQLYVPKDVIEQVFVNPEKMLVGDNRVVSILFSDIRSFTSISEKMAPDKLVDSLNRYFGMMVEIVMAREGVVDKFIGDAIMAIFGAPVTHGNDALSSVRAGLEMTEALKAFNRQQRELGAPEFKIGVGINYGLVTVGNIGCEKKMNYTVIGDMVNLASRLEGLTKMYHEPILLSHATREAIGNELPFRLIDKVAVKGKKEGVPIYTTRQSLEEAEDEIWAMHEGAVERYYRRDFQGARRLFQQILALDEDDIPAKRFLERCEIYVAKPPAEDWDGVEIMTEK